MLQLHRREQYAIGVLVIVIAAMVIYFDVIFPRDGESVFPWSSDAWGHLVKAVYLREQLAQGNLYPDLFPAWYNGQQLLRYFPPLSYYSIVGLYEVTGNIFTAGNLFIFLFSLAGSLSFLLFANRIGIVWAILAGLIFMVFPDNLRVAFAEGNMPRIAATALLPLAFYLLLRVLERPESKRSFTGLVVVISLIVLSHAMMAGIFLLGLGLYAVTYWLVRGERTIVAVSGIGALITGLMVSGWWLLPSLTGGISELDNNAASEAIASFSPAVALDPSLRGANNEIFYVGLSGVALLLASAFTWKRLDAWSRSLVIVTFVMTLIGTTFVVDAWRSLPGHELLWPIRFMSFSALGIALVSVIIVRQVYRLGEPSERRWLRLIAVGVLVLVLVDSQPSLQLIRSTERPAAVQEIADELAILDGWRVATVDMSRLGSAPAMLFTTEGNREQVFGWAFQGSITGPLLARLNQSLTDNFLEFAVSRLDRLGADDVVVLPEPTLAPGVGEALEADGFDLVSNSGALQLYHRDGEPRAFTIPMDVLGVGGGAQNASLLFPQMITGSSDNLDDYSDDFIRQFDTVVLSRFTTAERDAAGRRVERLAAGGTRFIVDMTGAPVSPLSRQPQFLGVHGEPVLRIEQATLFENGRFTKLLPFDVSGGHWNSVTPQGADEDLVMFEYPAARGAAVSRNAYGSGEVLFLGLNLFFHAINTRDEKAISLLEDLVGLPAIERPSDTAHALKNYRVAEDGWRFDIELPSDTWVLFPMAHHNGTRIMVNGESVDSVGIERLALARIPSGLSSVEILSERTGIYTAGNVATAIGLLMLAAVLLRLGPSKLRRSGIWRLRGRSGRSFGEAVEQT